MPQLQVRFPLSSQTLAKLTRLRQSGHTQAECTEPRSAEGVECRKCNEGLFAIL